VAVPRSSTQPAPRLGRADLAAFIRAQTRLAAPPLIPEITLWLSRDEPTVLWERLEQASGRSDLPPPFWAYPWAGGIALARYLLDHPDQVAGQPVLDLASGSGLVAIVAARLGAATVTASDIDPVAVTVIGLNAQANGITLTVTEADLLAGPPPDRPEADPSQPVHSVHSGHSGQPVHSVHSDHPDHPDHPDRPDHVGQSSPLDHLSQLDLTSHSSHTGPSCYKGPGGLVLVGDAFYERRMAHRALGFLRRMRDGGARVLIGDPGRAYLPTDLRELARYPVPAWAGLEDTEIKPTTVWELP
jgi:predicted nicotinamide N-methyase